MCPATDDNAARGDLDKSEINSYFERILSPYFIIECPDLQQILLLYKYSQV